MEMGYFKTEILFMAIKTSLSYYLHNVQLHNCACIGRAKVSKSPFICVCMIMLCGFLACS